MWAAILRPFAFRLGFGRNGAAVQDSGSPSFVDVHCHLLPGIDDGAVSWEESLAMAGMAVEDGISTVIATPHQLGSHGHNHGGTIRASCVQLQEFLDRRGVGLRVEPGADVRIEPDMIRKIQAGEVLTLADHRRYVLLELPHELCFPLDRLLHDLDASGMVGVLSHPERNQGFLARPQLLEPLVDGGCLLQVTAASLVGTFGPRVKSLSEWLVREGFVHFIATDAHGSKQRRPLMRRAYDRVAAIVDPGTARRLCCENPACVVANGKIARGRHKPKGWTAGWFRWGKAG
jgi:protein-tyrosine phosphatase